MVRTLLKIPDRVALCICCFNISSLLSSSLRWARVLLLPGAGLAELLDDIGVSITTFTGGESEEPCGDTEGVDAVDDSGTFVVPAKRPEPFPLEANLFGGTAAALVE